MTKREELQKNPPRNATLDDDGKPRPEIKNYLDAMAALIPAEAMAAHAALLVIATKTITTTGKPPETTITENGAKLLSISFWLLLLVAAAFYILPRVMKGVWDTKRDYYRMLIPPAAFVAWMMLQRTTAFDAVCTTLESEFRTGIAIFMAMGLGIAATLLAYTKEPK